MTIKIENYLFNMKANYNIEVPTRNCITPKIKMIFCFFHLVIREHAVFAFRIILLTIEFVTILKTMCFQKKVQSINKAILKKFLD